MTGPVLTAVLGTDPVVWVAVGLALVGVLGTLVPLVPGALLSLGGVYLYWWSTGYSDPGTLFIIFTVILTIMALLLDWFSGAITAKMGGASNKTSFMAGIAGIFGFIFLGGPVGVIIAVGGTVFLREYMKTGNARDARKAGIYSAIGVFASAFMQAAITITIFIGFLLALVF